MQRFDVDFWSGIDLLPSISEKPSWISDTRIYLFDMDVCERGSWEDDEPFGPTPVEIECMGGIWARGMSERSAALNRIAIVKAALVRQRDAILAEQREAVTA